MKDSQEGQIIQAKCPLCGHSPVYKEGTDSHALRPYYCHGCNASFDSLVNVRLMTLEEFISHASGQTYSDALFDRIRPATPSVVAQIQALEETKRAVRDCIREAFPTTRSWSYETSWRHNREALARIYDALLTKAVLRG